MDGAAHSSYVALRALCVGLREEDEKLVTPDPCDDVAGTSIGASVAAVYALGFGPDEIAEKMDLVGAAAFRLHLSTSALLSNSGLREGLRAIGGSTRIEDMRVPLAVGDSRPNSIGPPSV